MIGDVTAVVVITVGDDRITIVGAAHHAIELIAASRAEKLSGKMGLVIFPGLGQVTGLALGIAGAALFGSSRKHIARVNGDGVQLVRGREFRLGTMGSARGEGGLQLTYRF